MYTKQTLVNETMAATLNKKRTQAYVLLLLLHMYNTILYTLVYNNSVREKPPAAGQSLRSLLRNSSNVLQPSHKLKHTPSSHGFGWIRMELVYSNNRHNMCVIVS